MSPDLTPRELDEVMSLFQDNPFWHSEKLLKAIPYLVQEIHRRRGTTGPTEERDDRINYPRASQGGRR